MRRHIEDGTYQLGELVEPQTYSKLVVMPDGRIEKKMFTLEGRRIPLEEIRHRIYNDHVELG